MRRLAALAFLIASPALAQTPPATYAPIMISEQDYKALQTYLGDQPMKFSAPIAAWLTSREQQAVAAQKAEADTRAKSPQADTLPQAPNPTNR